MSVQGFIQEFKLVVGNMSGRCYVEAPPSRGSGSMLPRKALDLYTPEIASEVWFGLSLLLKHTLAQSVYRDV